MARIRFQATQVEFTPAPESESESDRPPSRVPPDVEVEMDVVYEPDEATDGPFGELTPERRAEMEAMAILAPLRPWEAEAGATAETGPYVAFQMWLDWTNRLLGLPLAVDLIDFLGSETTNLYEACCDLADGRIGAFAGLSDSDRAALARGLEDPEWVEMLRCLLDQKRED